jgi:hypothetical protein
MSPAKTIALVGVLGLFAYAGYLGVKVATMPTAAEIARSAKISECLKDPTEKTGFQMFANVKGENRQSVIDAGFYQYCLNKIK